MKTLVAYNAAAPKERTNNVIFCDYTDDYYKIIAWALMPRIELSKDYHIAFTMSDGVKYQKISVLTVIWDESEKKWIIRGHPQR